MKEELQQVKEVLEESFDQPNEVNLDRCIQQLEQLKSSAGDKEQMLEDVIRAVTHAKHAQSQIMNAEDNSPSNAFGEAYRALDQAIQSYEEVNNDPFS